MIDWGNASIGDQRFDLARTKSILQLEGNRVGSPFEKKTRNLIALKRVG